MPKFLVEGSCDGDLFTETIVAIDEAEAEVLAAARLREAWGEDGEELDDLGDAASVRPYELEDYAHDEALEMLKLLRSMTSGAFTPGDWCEAAKVIVARIDGESKP
jgi:hypothetical protein